MAGGGASVMSESQNQKQIVKQVDELFYYRWPKLMVPLPRTNRQGCAPQHAPLIAIRNEGKQTAGGKYQAKLAGLAAGFPDMMLMVSSCGYLGLIIENKSEDGTMKSRQITWADWLSSHGYLCVECRSVKEAVDTVIGYMGGKL